MVVAIWLALVAAGAAAFDDDGLKCRPLVGKAADPVGSIRFGEGLLFRVSRPGMPPSHVFGTVHVDLPAVTTLAPPVRRAFDASRALVVETLLDEPAAMAEMATRMRQPPGRHLQAQAGKALFARAAALLVQYGVDAAGADALKPWAAFITLNLPPEMIGMPLDLRLVQEARRRGLALYGLETMAEQVDVLDRMTLDDQVQLLADTVCHYDALQLQMTHLIDRYVARDLAGVVRLADGLQVEGDAAGARLKEELLGKRNRRMAQRVAPRLAEGHAFVAVGALHLPGDDGLLALLESQGFTVERVH